MKIQSFLLYGIALLLLGTAVNRMVRDAEEHAYQVTDKEIREAWASGFERGVASVKPPPKEIREAWASGFERGVASVKPPRD